MGALDEASRYGEAGFEVFPVRGKSPLTTHGHNEATSNESKIREWWRIFPDAGIGLRPGEDIIVIDLDGAEGVLHFMQLESQHEPIPNTPRAATGGGGLHYFFRAKGIKQKTRWAPGCDTRSHKGYIVAPPSPHPSGRNYSWEVSIFDVPIADCPAWLYALLPKEEEPRSLKPSVPLQQGGEVDEARARDALQFISPECDNDAWVSVGMALHSTGEPWAFEVWDDWSRGSPEKYHEGECKKRWRSFRGGGRTMSTIWRLARDAGWTPKVERPAGQQREPGDDDDVDEYDGFEEAYCSDEPIIHEPKIIPKPDKDWRSQLVRTSKGKLKPNISNVMAILRFDPRWFGVLAYDEFRVETITLKKPPWGNVESRTYEPGTPWQDGDDFRMNSWFSREYDLEIQFNLGKLVETVARLSSFDPVTTYLNELTWDWTERLETAPMRHFGAEDTEYHRLVWKWWMISAVARAFEPGCKADYALIFEGNQGLKKSQALAILAKGWFLDTPVEIGTKDSFMALRGHWIVEMAELDSLSRAESTRAKAFFSGTTDSFRPPYGARYIAQPRRCVFAGSTNEKIYLKDPTGGRRYWPIRCSDEVCDLSGLREEVDQLWAEAVTLYKAGARWYPDTQEEHALCTAAQEERYQEDAWEMIISKWIKGKDEFSLDEVLREALDIPSCRMDRPSQVRAGAILSRLGCRPTTRRANSSGIRVRMYARQPPRG